MIVKPSNHIYKVQYPAPEPVVFRKVNTIISLSATGWSPDIRIVLRSGHLFGLVGVASLIKIL